MVSVPRPALCTLRARTAKRVGRERRRGGGGKGKEQEEENKEGGMGNWEIGKRGRKKEQAEEGDVKKHLKKKTN